MSAMVCATCSGAGFVMTEKGPRGRSSVHCPSCRAVVSKSDAELVEVVRKIEEEGLTVTRHGTTDAVWVVNPPALVRETWRGESPSLLAAYAAYHAQKEKEASRV